MTQVIIKVENLGKRYTIGHQGDNGNYVAFRDVLMRNAQNLWTKTKDFARGKPGVMGDTTEEFWALKDLDFEIRKGEALGIIGRNGAGKSTLLKVLSRITEPSAGRVTIKGRVASLLEVGTGFHPELTARENIFLNGAILGMKRFEIKAKFDDIVAFAEVEKFLDTPVKRYSSGMYMRLAFAVAAHLEPEILLVDEVLAVGDMAFQNKCLSKMGDVAKEGRTVLVVSHNMSIIANLCARTLLIENGKVFADGNTNEVISGYISSVSDGSGQVVWDNPRSAPGNHKLRLHAAKILSIEGKLCTKFNIDTDVLIHISYWNLIDGRRVNVGIFLKDELGNIVLASVNIPPENLGNDIWGGEPHPVGLFDTVCRIPGSLLNSKTYIVEVMGATSRFEGNDFYVRDALSFEVVDLGSRNIYNIEWQGMVRPKLTWSTEYLEKPSFGRTTNSMFE